MFNLPDVYLEIIPGTSFLKKYFYFRINGVSTIIIFKKKKKNLTVKYNLKYKMIIYKTLKFYISMKVPT